MVYTLQGIMVLKLDSFAFHRAPERERERLEASLRREANGAGVCLPYSSGTMIPNRPSSFKPFIVSGGMLASQSILAESTRNDESRRGCGDRIHSVDVMTHQTFFTEEPFHRSNELLDLLQFFISDFWIGKDFILKKEKRGTLPVKPE